MSPDHSPPDNADVHIAPARVRISARPIADEVIKRNHPVNRSTWLGLGGLLALVAWVVFVLPGQIADRADSQQSPGKTVTPAPTPQQAERSPFAEAQLARDRKAAQEVLQRTLEQQELVASKAVEQWAPEDYQRGLDMATQGDAAYQQREFETAQQRYREAGQLFDELNARADQRLAQALQEGENALAQGQSESARTAFDVALAIDPGNQAALTGRKRAATIEQVFALLKSAQAAESTGQLTTALNTFKQAIAIDAAASTAAQGMQRIEQRMTEQEFTHVMAEGKAALANNDLATARKRFEQATALRSGSREAHDALREITQTMTTQQVTALLADARRLEAQEQWADAEAKFSAALQADPEQTDAREGQTRTKMRADLDRAISTLLAQPERLLNESVYTEAVKLQRNAEAITSPSPRLKEQLAKLAQLVKDVRSPTAVVLESDDKTSVTVFKVGNFGTFKKHELSLLPGSYAAVGVRKGYRDVRVEFTVRPGQPVPPVVVQCTEQI